MGVNLKDLLIKHEIEIDSLAGKTLAVDTFNVLFQFLTTIRQPDGSLLMDSHNKVTSHLSGLFFRTTNLMKRNIKLIFVFDGTPPELKKEEIESRKKLKAEAIKKYEIAKEREDIEEMKKYASRAAFLTGEMIEESKELISALGLPYLQAPSEGEAQASYIVKKGDAYAVASEDYDSLLSGAPKLIKNLSISGKKKIASKLAYKSINPELIDLKENLDSLEISNDQLIAIAMLIGTDFNPKGIKGIGPKNAIKLVKEHKSDFDALFKKVEWEKRFSFPWQDVFNIIKHMPVEKDYDIRFKKIDADKVRQILIERHDFSSDRVNSALKSIEELEKSKNQGSLSSWI